MVKGYCVFYNRGRSKGEGTKTEITNTTIREIDTRRGIKYQLIGTCSVCKHKVTIMTRNPNDQTNKDRDPKIS